MRILPAKMIKDKSKLKLYNSWASMIGRCHNKNNKDYKTYGLIGIKVCARWRGRGGFKRFLSDMGDRPEGMTIERIDGSKGYSKKNCKWATRLEQSRNTSRCRKITINGAAKCISNWEKDFNLTKGTISRRIKEGLSGKLIKNYKNFSNNSPPPLIYLRRRRNKLTTIYKIK